MRMWNRTIVGILVGAFCAVAQADIPRGSVVEKIAELRKNLKLDAYSNETGFIERLKKTVIVIGDIGFRGLDHKNDYVPDSNLIFLPVYPKTFFEQNPVGFGKFENQKELTDSDHGRRLAQIVWNLTKVTLKSGETVGPKIVAVNARRINNFARMAKFVSTGFLVDGNKPSVVIFANNWEAGNFDSSDFYSAYAKQMTDAGILFYVAAGSYRGRVHNCRVKVDIDRFVKLGANNDLKELRLTSNVDDNMVNLQLSWNSFGKTSTAGTLKDLDIHLYDENGIEEKHALVEGEWVAQSAARLQQLAEGPPVGEEPPPGQHNLPAESMNFKFRRLGKGQYYRVRIKVRDGSVGEFSDLVDRLRLVVIPSKDTYTDDKLGSQPAVTLLDSTPGEDVMSPGNEPTAITVSDIGSGSSTGGVIERGVTKPDIFMDSSNVQFSDDVSTWGTSNATAIMGAVGAVLKAAEPKLNRDHVVKFVEDGMDYIRRNHHKFLVDHVESLVGKGQVIPMVSLDRRLMLAVPMDPPRVKNLFPEFPYAENRYAEFDYYLSLRAQTGSEELIIKTDWRDRATTDFPWNPRAENAQKPEKAGVYLPVVKAKTLAEVLAIGTPLRRLGFVPDPVQLREAVK